MGVLLQEFYGFHFCFVKPLCSHQFPNDALSVFPKNRNTQTMNESDQVEELIHKSLLDAAPYIYLCVQLSFSHTGYYWAQQRFSLTNIQWTHDLTLHLHSRYTSTIKVHYSLVFPFLYSRMPSIEYVLTVGGEYSVGHGSNSDEPFGFFYQILCHVTTGMMMKSLTTPSTI